MTENNLIRPVNKPFIIAHRGAAGLEPENTLVAFERAIEEGCDAIELDVRLSADGVPVVFHDRNLERMTGKERILSDVSVRELEHITIRDSHRIPLFEDIIEILSRRTLVDIEIKEDTAVHPVMTILQQKQLTDRVIISSFSEKAVRAARRIDARIKTGLIMGRQTWNPVVRFKEAFPFLTLMRCSAQCLIIHHSLATRFVLTMARILNIPVFLWASLDEEKTVNEHYFKKAWHKKVQGIATIWPGQLNHTIKTLTRTHDSEKDTHSCPQ
ncbi:glycerophosphodiester phosphodiesterase [bacterium]|nr:glycerophosphodiester phosphodiesterase [bacterium]